jgi:hypothetical protein
LSSSIRQEKREDGKKMNREVKKEREARQIFNILKAKLSL